MKLMGEIEFDADPFNRFNRWTPLIEIEFDADPFSHFSHLVRKIIEGGESE